MKAFKKILFLLILFTSFCSIRATNLKESKLINTFKFIATQQCTLESIKGNYPKLIIEANIAEYEFNKKYGKAISTIFFEAKLEIENKGIDFKNYLITFNRRLNENFDLLKMSQNEAQLYILEVKSRTEGNMPSQHLEIIVKFKNRKNTSTSLLSSYNIHEVKSYSNSRIIELKVKIPTNWKEIDGIRPSVLKSFRNEYGNGNQIINIDRIDNVDELQSFTKMQLVKFVPKNGKNISTYTKTIQGKKVGILEYEQENAQENSTEKRSVIQYIILHKKDVLLVHFAAYGEKNENLTNNLKQSEPLYKSIVESILFTNSNNQDNIITTKN